MVNSTMVSPDIPPRFFPQTIPVLNLNCFAPGTCQPPATSPFPAAKGLTFTPQPHPVVAITPLPLSLALSSQLAFPPLPASCPATGHSSWRASRGDRGAGKVEVSGRRSLPSALSLLPNFHVVLVPHVNIPGGDGVCPKPCQPQLPAFPCSKRLHEGPLLCQLPELPYLLEGWRNP